MQLIGLLLNLAAITGVFGCDIYSLISFSWNSSFCTKAEWTVPIALSSEDEVLTLSPSEDTLVRYTNESLIVQCLGLTADVQLQWKSPKGEIIKERRGRIHVEQSQNKESPEQLQLVITHISLADKGNWTCEDANTGDQASKTLNLIVYQKITFTENTTILAVKEGKTATIFCEVKGEPQPNVTWNFNGQPITMDPNLTKFRILADGLLINKVTQNDTGEYTCRAYQVNTIASDIQERTVLLKIEHKPFWVQKQDPKEPKYAYINGTRELVCEAVAEPPAEFTWYRQGQRIHNNKYYTITNDNNSISTLLIHALDKSVFAAYKCRAQNSHGRIERELILEQGEKPAPPVHLVLRGFNSNTFDVDLGAIRTSNVRHHMDINGFRIEYMTEYEFKADAGKWTKAKGKDFKFEDGATFLINNLEHNTTYFMRAASRNAAGLSDWTKVEKFTTLSNEPPSAASSMEHLTRTQILCITLVALILSKELSFGFRDVGKITKLEKFIGLHF